MLHPMKLNIVIVKNIIVAQRVMIVLALSVRLKPLRHCFGGCFFAGGLARKQSACASILNLC